MGLPLPAQAPGQDRLRFQRTVLQGWHLRRERHRSVTVPQRLHWPVLPSQMRATRWWQPVQDDRRRTHHALSGVALLALDKGASIPANHILFLRYRLQPVPVPGVIRPSPLRSHELYLAQFSEPSQAEHRDQAASYVAIEKWRLRL